MDFKSVTLNNKDYVVIKANTQSDAKNILFVIDECEKDKVIRNKWHKKQQTGYIGMSCKDENGVGKEMYLHNFVMGILTFNGKGCTQTVDHIDRIPCDNRKENLRLVSQSVQNMNQKKRDRKIDLPKDCGIAPDNIPTNVSYGKAEDKFGDYFELDIDLPNGTRFRKKSSKSTNISLKCKLEEIKKYIHELNEQYAIKVPFEKIVELTKSYNEIIKLSGFDCWESNIVPIPEKDDKIGGKHLTENTDLTEAEKELINNVSIHNTAGKKKTKNTLPPDCGITKDKIPKYCYYSPATDKRGDAFNIDNHPKLIEKTGKKSWKTSGSSKISTKDKFDELIEKLKAIET